MEKIKTSPTEPHTDVFRSTQVTQNTASPSSVWTTTSTPQENTRSDVMQNFWRVVTALRKRWWIVLSLTAISIGGMALYTSRQPKLYEASASIVIDAAAPNVLGGNIAEVVSVGSGGYWATDAYYATEYDVIRSRAVARKAGEKLAILADDARAGLDRIPPEEREQVRKTLDPADFIEGRYSVEPDKHSTIVRVSAVDADPKFAADLANAVAAAYMEQNLDKRIDATRWASTELSVQNQDLKKKLEESEDALYQFMEQNDVLNASLVSQQEEVKQRLQTFIGKLAETQTQRISSELLAKALKDVQKNPALVDTIPEIANNPVITAIKAKLVDLQGSEVELSQRYKPKHPKIDAVRKQVVALEGDLQKEITSVLVALQRQQDGLRQTERGIESMIERERTREARLNKLLKDYQRLTREVDNNEKLYAMITSRLKETDLTSALKINNVRILDGALVPSTPFKPDWRINLVIGAMMGFFLSIVLVVILELSDTTIKSQDDVETYIGATFLGLIPMIDLHKNDAAKLTPKQQRERDLFVFDNPKSSHAESCRFIRTNLIFMSPDQPLRTLLITSPGPGEGKTTTAISLAVTMAQSGSRTLLVDTDMRRPRIHRSFNLSNEVGLSTLIVGESTIEQAVQKTVEPNLDVIVCGPIPPNPAELLHTQRFENLVEDLKKKYDRIIFDAPPVAAVADPVILGAQVDGAILVIKCLKTTREIAQQALRSLRDAKAHIFGTVLNDVDLSRKQYGGYYYQYYRAQGYSEDTPKNA